MPHDNKLACSIFDLYAQIQYYQRHKFARSALQLIQLDRKLRKLGDIKSCFSSFQNARVILPAALI